MFDRNSLLARVLESLSISNSMASTGESGFSTLGSTQIRCRFSLGISSSSFRAPYTDSETAVALTSPCAIHHRQAVPSITDKLAVFLLKYAGGARSGVALPSSLRTHARSGQAARVTAYAFSSPRPLSLDYGEFD